MSDNDLWFIWRGRGWIGLPTGRVEIRPGQCIWLRPGWRYTTGHDARDPVGVLYLHFDLLDRLGQIIDPASLQVPHVMSPLDVDLVDRLAGRILELLWNDQFNRIGRNLLAAPADYNPFPPADDPGRLVVFTRPDPASPDVQAATALLRGLLMDLTISGPLPDSRSLPTWQEHRQLALRLAMQIRENPAGVVSVAELAQREGYSPDHLTRIFKSVIGKSPQQFLVAARVARAQTLLQDTKMPIKRIAAELGYRNEYYFSRQFRQHAGCTPTQYRAG